MQAILLYLQLRIDKIRKKEKAGGWGAWCKLGSGIRRYVVLSQASDEFV